MRLIKILLFILISYNGFSQNIGVGQIRGLQSSLNSRYSSVTTLSDSTGFTLNRPNGTKDTIQIAIPASVDTTNKWVNNIYKLANDANIYFKIGGTTYSIKDSVGGGGTGSAGLDTSAIHKTGDETVRSGIKSFSSSVTSTGGTAHNTTGLIVTPSLAAAITGDTLTGILVQPTFNANSQINTAFYGLKSMNANLSVNKLTLGTAKNFDITNTVFGYSALDALTSAAGNGIASTAIGWQALKAMTNSSFSNTAVGYATAQTITTGTNNTAIGTNAMSTTSVGVGGNTAIGSSALAQITGSNNVGIGVSAGRNAASGGVYFGNNAGQGETGSNKLYFHNTNVGALVAGDMSTGQIKINADTRETNAASLLTPAATFEVNNNASITSRGSIPAPRMTQTQRDAIATQAGVITKIIVTNMGGPTSAPTVTISGTGTGATAVANYSASGYYITMTNGGTGYTPNSTTVSITGGGTTGATGYVVVGNGGLSVYCLDCTATDSSIGVLQYWNGQSWKNAW